MVILKFWILFEEQFLKTTKDFKQGSDYDFHVQNVILAPVQRIN